MTKIIFHYFESFLLEYESRFERKYGYFRPIIQEVVDRYLDFCFERKGLKILQGNFLLKNQLFIHTVMN